MTDDLPTGYKMTELGPLPQEWRVVRLGEVFDIVQGKSLSAKQNRGLRPRPFLRTSNVCWGYVDLSKLDIMDFTEEEEEKFALQPDDLLVCEGGEVGRTAIWEGQMQGVYYQNHLHRLRAINSDVFPRFVMYWLQTAFTLLNLYSGTSNKTTIPNLSQGRLAAFSILLPPLPEQRAIAHVLRTVQEAKEATERVIAALRELKKSLMRHLFTCGPVPLDAAGNVELRETEIGPIPAHWQVVRLGDLVERGILTMRNGFPQGEHNESGVGVPHLRPFNITNEGFLDLSQIKFVAPPSDDDPHWLHPGDVVFNNTNSEELVGKTALFNRDGRFVLSNHMTFLRIQEPDQIDPYWLARLLHLYWHLGMYRALCRRHVNQASISLERLKGIRIPLPPLPEQRAIAEALRAVDRKIEAEEARRQALEALFKTLLHHLMTAKIRLPIAFVQGFQGGRSP